MKGRGGIRGRVGRGCRTASRGFSLIELVVVLGLMLVLLMLSVPPLRDAALGSTLASYANGLVASVNLARNEAFKRNAVITVCVSSSGTACTPSGEWKQGWIVMCHSDDNITCDPADTGILILQKHGALDAGFKVIQTLGGTSLDFQPIGVGSTQAVLTFCRASPLGEQERILSINTTGESTVRRTTTGSCP